MNVEPAPLTDAVKQACQKSIERSAWTWGEVEEWIAARVACVWRIGETAYAITAASEGDFIDVIVCGGSGSQRATQPFLAHMQALPEHEGQTLRIEGRRGWKRYCKNWDCEEIGGGDVVLTKKVL